MGNSGSAKHVDARDATVSEVYLQIDPPRPPSFNSIPHRTKGTAVILVSLFLCFGMPFFEPSFIQPHWAWGYEATGFAGLPRAYALVLLCNAVLPTFVMSYLAFGVVSQGRKKYGYKLPVMYASVDIHVLDVAAGGAILSDGNSMAAQQKLKAAAASAFAAAAAHRSRSSASSSQPGMRQHATAPTTKASASSSIASSAGLSLSSRKTDLRPPRGGS